MFRHTKITNKIYWRYRAYNADYHIVVGITESPNIVEMAVKLRQAGWQVISAETIDQATYLAEQRLEKWHKLISEPTQPSNEPPNYKTRAVSSIHRVASWLIGLFFTK
jgi:hypothetical protein